uniref:Uncharacterized protein n=1 Tax=Glossina palpalis gambiensis TaxID=67801 RepID=A0A1B0BWL0_9MUSC
MAISSRFYIPITKQMRFHRNNKRNNSKPNHEQSYIEVTGSGTTDASALLRRADLCPPDGIFFVPPAALKRNLLVPTAAGAALLTDGSSSDCAMYRSDKELPVEIVSLDIHFF